jgi:hypothetical protein
MKPTMSMGQCAMGPIQRLFQSRLSQPYQPTVPACRWWYGVLSRDVFALEFPPCGFAIIHCPESWAYYDPDRRAIELAGQFTTKQQFVAVLGHEMIHHWQHTLVGARLNHGKSFRTWKQSFNRHGIQLAIHGNVHIPPRLAPAATRCTDCLVASHQKNPVA